MGNEVSIREPKVLGPTIAENVLGKTEENAKGSNVAMKIDRESMNVNRVPPLQVMSHAST